MLKFDGKAASYNSHAHIQRDTADWVAEWLPQPSTSDTCLEFGAGTGHFTRHLSGRFAHLEASDIAPHMVEEGERDLPAVHWTQRDAWGPGKDADFCSFIASCSLLQWAADPVTVLRAWRTLLQPGGRSLSGIYIDPSLPELGSLLPSSHQFPWRTADDWRTHFTDAGFSINRSETKTCNYVYPSVHTLFRRLHGTGATLPQRPLPGEQIRELWGVLKLNGAVDRDKIPDIRGRFCFIKGA